jgi:hypothetical protein
LAPELHRHSGCAHRCTVSSSFCAYSTSWVTCMKGMYIGMCADMATVERVVAFITACQVDGNCHLRSAAAAQSETDRSRDVTLFGLKVGLALSIIAMTVTSSFIPAAVMQLPMFNVRRLLTALLHDAVHELQPANLRFSLSCCWEGVKLSWLTCCNA